MSNTYLTIITTILRALFTALAGALAAHVSPAVYDVAIDIITKLGGPETVTASVIAFLAPVGWAIYLRMKSKLHLEAALALPSGATTTDVKNATEDKSVFSTLTSPNLPK